jgi:DNA-binding transcriptional ArsR family regulator
MTEVLDKDTLKALSTDTRQEIIKMLSNRPYTASEISKITNKHVTTITEHLNVLEKSDLIRRKESTNKWVYYELSDKGGRLFKPKIYSWVVMICVSALIFVFGFAQIFFTSFSAGAPAMTQAEGAKIFGETRSVSYYDNAGIFIGIILMAIGIFLFVYFFKAYKTRRALL